MKNVPDKPIGLDVLLDHSTIITVHTAYRCATFDNLRRITYANLNFFNETETCIQENCLSEGQQLSVHQND